jgi:hypothetical protein
MNLILAFSNNLLEVCRRFAGALKLANQRGDRVNAAVAIGERLHPAQSSGRVQLFDDLRNQAATQRQVFTIDGDPGQRGGHDQGIAVYAGPP